MSGRVCLIKSVFNALPLFYFSFFKAPAIVCKIIRRAQAKFLWGWDFEGKKIVWVAWDKICSPIDMGGLGIKNVRKFNVALLAKWLLRLRLEEVGVWRDIIESRYSS